VSTAGEPLELVGDEVRDIAEAPEDIGLSRRDPILTLQHMEAAVTRADLEFPDVLSRQEFRRLRYLLSFARLTVFEPGAAGPGGMPGRGDVNVGEELKDFREAVVASFFDPLRHQQDPKQRLIAAKELLEWFTESLEHERAELARRHADDFSLAELDAEVCYKALVCVMGGGGGAGYVYLGGLKRLVEEGMVPAYMLTTSFGSIVGSIFARSLPMAVDDYVAWAKTVTYRGILGPSRRRRRHGLTGLFGLHFDTFAADMFQHEEERPLQLRDLAVPFETVVAGVRRQSFDRLPARFRRSELSTFGFHALPRRNPANSAAVAARMWQTAAFIDSRVVKPIVLGGDELTAGLNVVDAASFSSSIPGVLHHETRDPKMVPLLDEVLAQKDVGALVDGVAASNVPVELAWRRVQDGRIGTRNVCVYAWDCFHPQWNPKHLWLQPITQAVQIQMVRNAPFADHMVRFSPTLSVLTLAASSRAIDNSLTWGSASLDASLPFIKHLLEPVWWEGDGPPVVERPQSEAQHESQAQEVRKVIDRPRLAHRLPAWAKIPRRRG
jgi:predicted acylesterase/phospholipase RssA